MNKIIYLEPDEDITSVINRIRKSDEDGVVLAIPRGGTIGQSAVNLKLLARNAATLGKSIGLVTSDKITQNLSSRLEMKTFTKVSEAEKAHLGSISIAKPESGGAKEDQVIVGGLNVHTYQKYSGNDGVEEDDISEQTEVGEIEPDEDEEETADDVAEDTRDEAEISDEPAYRDADAEERRETKIPVRDDRDDDEYVTPMQRMPHKHLKPEGSRKAFVIISAIAVIAVLTLSYVFIPFAEASLVLKTEDSAKTLEVVADKSKTGIDTANLIIPAELVSVEKDGTKQANSTGAKDVGAKASGTATLYNNLATVVTIGAGTQITRDDKKFVTAKSVFVPAATGSFSTNAQGHLVAVTTPGTIDVDVTAAANGDSYNLATGNFSVAGRNLADVWAQNKSAFAGGVTKELKLVTADDIQKATDALKAELSAASETDLRTQAGEAGMKIADDSLSSEIVSTSSDKTADQEADNFTITMKIKAYLIGFKESDLRKLVLDSVKSGLDSSTMIVNEGGSTVNYKISSSSVNDGLIKLAIDFQGKVGRKLDQGKIKNEIKNVSAGSAESKLSALEGVASSSIKLSPSFWKLTPVLSNRIKIIFDYQKDSDVSGN